MMRKAGRLISWLMMGVLVAWGLQLFLTGLLAQSQAAAAPASSLPFNMVLLGSLVAMLIILLGRVIGGVFSNLSDSTRVEDWMEEISYTPLQGVDDVIPLSSITPSTFEKVSMISAIELSDSSRHFVWDESFSAHEILEGDYA